MHVVSRRYSGPGAKEAIAVGLARQHDLGALMRSVPGFVAYTVIKVGDDAWITATICQDKAGCDQSVQKAREWVAANVAHTGVAAPEVTEGEVLLRITA
jgi:hypothetical protein